MTLDFTNFFDFGVYADLFSNADQTRVYKVFCGPSHPRDPYGDDDVERRRRTFQSEVDAYHILSQHSALSLHAPEFFGTECIQDVIRDGKSVAGDYLLDCAYVMEFIHGPPPVKVGACEGSYEHLGRAVADFETAGIHNMKDACVFFPEDEHRFKFIDFATEVLAPPDYKHTF